MKLFGRKKRSRQPAEGVGGFGPDTHERGVTEEELTPAEKREVKRVYSTPQAWAALRKSWKGYKVAKAEHDSKKAAKYARYINDLQGALGVQQTKFKDA